MPDVPVVLLRTITPGVEVQGKRSFDVQDDEGAVLVAAQNNSKRPSSYHIVLARKFNDGNLRNQVMTASEMTYSGK